MASFAVITHPLSTEDNLEFSSVLQRYHAACEFGTFDMDSMTGFSTIICPDENVEALKGDAKKFVQHLTH